MTEVSSSDSQFNTRLQKQQHAGSFDYEAMTISLSVTQLQNEIQQLN